MSEFRCLVVDGVIFQYRLSGIARVWAALLREWKKSGFARNVVFLDRGGTYQSELDQGNHDMRVERIKKHDFTRTGSDSLALEEICLKVKADLFVSTFYTTPTLTPSLFFGYDMIPEVKGVDLGHEGWREKKRAILHAAAHLMISKSSARDLEELYQFRPGSTYVAYCGLLEKFYKPGIHEITNFRKKFAVGDGPYLLMVGERIGAGGYKNGDLVFNGVRQLKKPSEFTIICVGGAPYIEPPLLQAAKRVRALRLDLDDDDLRAAYGGAHALIYPSRYEGFGLPVIEAMACGSPVVTCRNSSLAEIADGAALFVGEDDPSGVAQAIVEVGKPSVRERLIAEGFRRSKSLQFQRNGRERGACADRDTSSPRSPRVAAPKFGLARFSRGITDGAGAKSVRYIRTKRIPQGGSNNTVCWT